MIKSNNFKETYSRIDVSGIIKDIIMNQCVFLEIDAEKCFEKTEKLFAREAGLNKQGEKFDKMREDAYRILDVVRPRINIKTVYAYYDDIRLDGRNLTIAGETLECIAFQQIEPEAIEGAFVYAVSAGDFYLENKPVLEQLYADIWGTAFADAVRELMIGDIGNEVMLSDSFGPGFYGMSMDEMQKMPSLVDFKTLGIEVRPSNVLIPLKSCSGIFLKVNERYRPINSACQLCYGASKTCRLCGINKKFRE